MSWLSMNKSIKIVFIMIAFLLVLYTHSLAGQFKVTRVYDGDTIMAEGHDIIIYVLLAGIDAPEIGSPKQQRGQPYGQEAKKYLKKLILNKIVDIKGYGLGPYPFNHLIGELYLKDKNINIEMVKRGLAEVYREKYPERLNIVPYLEAEKEAKSSGRGMWYLGEEYISPQDWRKMYKARYSIR